MESRLNSSGTSSPGFTTLQLCGKVTDLLSRLGETPDTFTGKNSLCGRCSTTFPVTVKAMKKNVWQIPKSSPYLQRSLVLDSGHLLVQVPKRSGILWKRIVHKEFGIISRTRCCWNSQKADVLFPCNDSIVQVSAQKQRTRETVDTFYCGLSNN